MSSLPPSFPIKCRALPAGPKTRESQTPGKVGSGVNMTDNMEDSHYTLGDEGRSWVFRSSGTKAKYHTWEAVGGVFSTQPSAPCPYPATSAAITSTELLQPFWEVQQHLQELSTTHALPWALIPTLLFWSSSADRSSGIAADSAMGTALPIPRPLLDPAHAITHCSGICIGEAMPLVHAGVHDCMDVGVG